MGMADMIDARKMRCERPAVVHHAADRHATEADAVVAALAADQPGAGRLTGRAMIGHRDLERGVDRLRTGIGEEDAVQSPLRNCRQLLGESEREGMTNLK